MNSTKVIDNSTVLPNRNIKSTLAKPQMNTNSPHNTQQSQSTVPSRLGAFNPDLFTPPWTDHSTPGISSSIGVTPALGSNYFQTDPHQVYELPHGSKQHVSGSYTHDASNPYETEEGKQHGSTFYHQYLTSNASTTSS